MTFCVDDDRGAVANWRTTGPRLPAKPSQNAMRSVLTVPSDAFFCLNADSNHTRGLAVRYSSPHAQHSEGITQSRMESEA